MTQQATAKHWKSTRKSRRGFTIVEVLIAVLILGIGLAAIAMSIVTSLRITNKSRVRSEALSQARLEVERLQTNTYNSAALTVGTNIPINRVDYQGYYRVVENTNDATKLVYMRIYYEDMNDPAATPGERQRVELQSMMSEALHP